jgi:hypothetical protein
MSSIRDGTLFQLISACGVDSGHPAGRERPVQSELELRLTVAERERSGVPYLVSLDPGV